MTKRRGGFYWVKDKPFVSVTEVLKCLDKPAIRWWFGNQIFLAMVKNPELDEKAAMASPYATSGEAKERGKAIHSLIEAYKASGARITPPKYKGYAKAFYSWVDKNKPKILYQEKTVISKKYGYGGTLDKFAKIQGKRDVIDFKTNKEGNIYDEVGLQLSAYKQGLIEAGEKVDGMRAVALAEDGSFAEKTFEDKLDIFLKVKDIWVWKNQKKCEKVGYIKK